MINSIYLTLIPLIVTCESVKKKLKPTGALNSNFELKKQKQDTHLTFF